MLAAGTTLGPYQIVHLIAEGGMGAVYLALHTRLRRQVALKVLKSDLAADADLVKRFAREAAMMAGMKHPHIAEVYDAGEDRGFYYFAMELLSGGSLQNEMSRNGAMPIGKALDIFRQIASALEYAHRHNAIHRDIKPANILRAADGRWALTDFGIALAQDFTRLTKTSLMMGTPAYMSPEQGQGLALDGRSDLYSLGVVLFEMLTGNLPFWADTPMGVIYKQIDAPPPRLHHFRADLPPNLQLFLDRCMAKRREDRFQSAGRLLADLDRLMRGQALSFRSAPFRPIQKNNSSSSGAKSASALGPVALGVVIGLIGLAILFFITRPVPARVEPARVATVLPPTAAPPRITSIPATSAPAPFAQPGQATYIVKAGDTLSDIAARFGISAEALLRANNLRDAFALKTGDALTIPAPEPTTKPRPTPPAPLADATRLVFTQGDVGSSHIVARYLSDGRENTFSAGGNTEEPSWSPDGAKIVAATGDPNVTPQRLVVFDAATGAQQIIFSSSSGALDPDWGSDGRIYFAQGDKSSASLFVIDPRTQSVTDLSRGGREPSLSPDRAYLAYMRLANNAWRIYVARISGNSLGDECEMQMPVAPNGVSARMPNWVMDPGRNQRVIFNVSDANTLAVALGIGDPSTCGSTLISLNNSVDLARPSCGANGFCVANRATATNDLLQGLFRLNGGASPAWSYVEQLSSNVDYAADVYP